MKKKLGSLRSIKFDETKFSVHPSAEDAYVYSKELNRQYDLNLFTPKFVQNLQAIHPLISVKSYLIQNTKKKVQYQFYSNWIWLDLIKQFKIDYIYVLEVDDVNAEEIAKLSWSYVVSEELLSINSKENFRELEILLQRVADISGSSPVDGGKKKVTMKTIERLSGESRGVIRGQQRKNIEEISALENYISNNPEGL